MVWERVREEMLTEDKPCGHLGEGALVLWCAQGDHINSALFQAGGRRFSCVL